MGGQALHAHTASNGSAKGTRALASADGRLAHQLAGATAFFLAEKCALAMSEHIQCRVVSVIITSCACWEGGLWEPYISIDGGDVFEVWGGGCVWGDLS